MSYCPTCNVDYREGFTHCADCGAALTERPASAAADNPGEPIEWVNVFTGDSTTADVVEADLQSKGFSVVRGPADALQLPLAQVGKLPGLFFTLSIPKPELEARQSEVDRTVAQFGGPEESGSAIAEAEEDYDVRGCPTCLLYFHETYSTCPGCGTALVPAVDIFAEGQLEPDRVIVAHGTADEVKAVAARLEGAGFTPDAFEVEGWEIDAVDLPWSELTDRTKEAEALLTSP